MKIRVSTLLFVFISILSTCCHEIANCEEIINRVVVVMDDNIITLYDLHKAALWKGMEYDKMTDEARRDLINQLINRDMVFQEINKIGGIKVDRSMLDAAVESIKTKNPDPGFSATDIEEYAKAQLLIQGFANQRFAPLIRIGDDEIRAYYHSNIAHLDDSHSSSAPAFAESYDNIKKTLEQRAINNLLKDWLDKQRAIHKIRIIEP